MLFIRNTNTVLELSRRKAGIGSKVCDRVIKMISLTDVLGGRAAVGDVVAVMNGIVRR